MYHPDAQFSRVLVLIPSVLKAVKSYWVYTSIHHSFLERTDFCTDKFLHQGQDTSNGWAVLWKYKNSVTFPNLEQFCRLTLPWNLLVKSINLFAAIITIPLLQISASFAFSQVLNPNTLPSKSFREISTSQFSSWKRKSACNIIYTLLTISGHVVFCMLYLIIT